MSIFRKLFGHRDLHQETPDFQKFIEGSMEGLRLQTQAHQSTWQFGKEDRWDFSQDTGEIVFTFSNTVVQVPAQIVGSYDSVAGSWLWAWGNESLSDALVQNSLRVREYGQQNHIQRLISAEWPAKELDAWHMAALTNRLCETNGVYRGPAGTTFVFFTLGKIQMSKKGHTTA